MKIAGVPGQMRHVTGELAASVHGDRGGRVSRLIEDLDFPGSNDEELEVPVADLHEDVAGARTS